jgi:hypothetical protein
MLNCIFLGTIEGLGEKSKAQAVHFMIIYFYTDVPRTAPRTVLEKNYLSLAAATPGSSFPSKNSSDAPPPVEI